MLLSIVIPTRNRSIYCIAIVKQILSLKLESTQIVVQDNSDDNSLERELEDYIKNGEIKYHYRNGIISFVDNFSEAISLCYGEYICMIGDDDGILPNIITVVKSAKQRNIDCVIAGLNAVYIWPSEHSIVKGGENGYLCLAYIKHKESSINPQKGLRQLASHGGQDYQYLRLPRVYHGIAKRSCLEEVKKIAGNYFEGLTPDIFIAVALGSVCKKVVRIHYPITISGICPKSGSSDSATGKHTGNLEDAPHFRGHKDYHWDNKAPRIYSVESIWAETALQALHIFNHKEIYNNFNIGLLDAICLKKYPQFAHIVKKHAKDNNVHIWYWICVLELKNLCMFANRVYRRIVNIKFGVKKYYNITDINQAVNITTSELEKVL